MRCCLRGAPFPARHLRSPSQLSLAELSGCWWELGRDKELEGGWGFCEGAGQREERVALEPENTHLSVALRLL